MIIPDLLRNSPWRKLPEIDRLARFLIEPPQPNHQAGTPLLAKYWARELERSAKAFEFDDVAFRAATAIQTRTAIRTIIRTARPPANPAWFEVRHADGSTTGYFVEGGRESFSVTVFSGHTEGAVPHVQISASLDRCIWGTVSPVINWTTFSWKKDGRKVNGNDDPNVILAACVIVACFWAFLGTPNVATITETITPEGRKAKARGRFTAAPIHRFNTVTLNLPRDVQDGGHPVHFQPGPGVRFHDVVGHRRLRKAPPPGSPALLRWLYRWWYGEVWIEPYHRGNRELRVVAKERRIKAK
jgi:hypothetical protein